MSDCFDKFVKFAPVLWIRTRFFKRIRIQLFISIRIKGSNPMPIRILVRQWEGLETSLVIQTKRKYRTKRNWEKRESQGPSPRGGVLFTRSPPVHKRRKPIGQCHLDNLCCYPDLVTLIYSRVQCCRSMTFWGGSGSADPCLWLMDPNPAIFIIDLPKMPTKTDLKKKIFLFTFWRYIYIIFKDKK